MTIKKLGQVFDINNQAIPKINPNEEGDFVVVMDWGTNVEPKERYRYVLFKKNTDVIGIDWALPPKE